MATCSCAISKNVVYSAIIIMRRMWGHACMDMYSKVKDVALYVRRYPCIPYSNFEFQITFRIEIGTAHIYVGISLHTAHIKYIMKYIHSVHQPRSFPLLAPIIIYSHLAQEVKTSHPHANHWLST